MNSKISYIYVLIFLSTLILSFFFKFDISNGGSSSDLLYHWNYILAIKEDIRILLEFNHSVKNAYSQHYPLHHLIISRFDFLTNKQENYLNFYFIFSLLLPVLFYYCLKNRFPQINTTKKIFISSIIYFLPNFQSSAIWGNSHISSLFFFLFSIYFLNILEKKDEKKINFNIFFVVFFMACASYIKQYYIIFFFYLFLHIILTARFKNIIFFFLLCLVLGFPGILFLINNPIMYEGLKGGYTDFSSSILIVLSILFVYLLPFFISNFKYNFIKSLELFKNKIFSIIFFLSSILFLYILINFNYIGYLGGGFFYKISKVLIGNNYLFFITSFSGMYLCFYFFRNKILDIFLIIIISISFSTGYFIFQKYFEPMVLFIFFLLIEKDSMKKVFNFNIHVIFFYFFCYWLSYFIYSVKLIEKINI